MQEIFIMDGDYSVSADGKVFSHKAARKLELSQCASGRGGKYRAVNLYQNGILYRRYVHRLVADAYLPNPNEYSQINHIDGNPSNNYVENLEWCSREQNIQHAYHNGLFPAVICVLCNEKYHPKRKTSNWYFCSGCKDRILTAAAIAVRNDEFDTEEIENALTADDLTSLGRKYLLMRARGMSYQNIADKLGCSRQNVHQIVKTAVKPAEGCVSHG